MIQDLHAEDEVLGCILTRPEDSMVTIGGDNLIQPDEFSSPPHQMIAQAMWDLDRHGRAITVNSIASQLNGAGLLQAAGGVEFIQSLTHSAGNLRDAADRVVRHAQLRQLANVGAIISTMAHADNADPDEVARHVEEELFTIRRRQTGTMCTIGDALGTWIARVNDIRDGNQVRMTATNFPALENLVGRLEPNDYMIIGGRPGDGKTTLLRYLALQMAVSPHPDQRQPIYIGDFEEGKIVWTGKMVSLITGIPWQLLRDRAQELTDEQMTAIQNAMRILQDVPIILESSAGPHVNVYRQRVRAAKRLALRRWGKELAAHCPDYLQRMKAEGSNDVSKNTAISHAVRDMCQEDQLYTPGICTAQLSRMPVNSSGQPQEYEAHHLKHSGAFEQDATVIVFPIRRWVFERPTRDEVAQIQDNVVNGRVVQQWRAEPVRFKAVKVRNGATGYSENLVWRKATGRYEAA